MGQRGVSVLVSGVILVVLYFVGVLAGRAPGQLPLGPDGLQVTPELLMQYVWPIIALVGTLGYLWKSISNNVNGGQFDPNNIRQLFMVREFWMSVVVTIFAGLQMFGLRFWTDSQEPVISDMLINILMTIFGGVTASYSGRPNGTKVTKLASGGTVFVKNFIEKP